MDLVLTQTIQDTIQYVVKEDSFKTNEKEELERILAISLKEEKEPIKVSWALLQDVSTFLMKLPYSKDKPKVHEIMKGTSVYIEPKIVEPRDPEYDAYMEKLRAEQQERDYENMVSNVVATTHNIAIFSTKDMKEAKGHIATIINILFSMIAVYVAVYMASRTMMEDIGLRVLLSMAGAFSIGITEVFLYVSYTNKSKSKKLKKSISKKKKYNHINTLLSSSPQIEQEKKNEKTKE
ncbi:unnamed protein product [Cunninghamella blakesleeana]